METIDHAAFEHRTPGTAGRIAAWVRRRRWFLAVVLLPTLVAALYYGLVASDIYVSESRFVIKSPSQKQTQMSTLANLIQTTGLSSGQEQTSEVLDYVRSRNALLDLTRTTDVRDRFAASGVDALSRYPGPFQADRFENLYEYYSKMVSAQVDHDTGMAILSVKAFTPEDAYVLNGRLLDLSEALVNRLNERAQDKAVAEAERTVEEAAMRLSRASAALGRYRNEAALLDPTKQGTGVLDISNRLVAQQASMRAQLQSIERVAPRNPAIPALRDQIAAVGAQIATQNGRAVGTSGGIASKLAQYEKLSVEQQFATQMLNASSANLEQARSDAQKQQFYLERVVDPNRPDMPALPHRIRLILTVFAAAICLYLIGWMLLTGIMEHAPGE